MLLTKPTTRQSVRALASAPERHPSRLLVEPGILVDADGGVAEPPKFDGSTPRSSATSRTTRPSPPPPTAIAVPGPRPRRSSTWDGSSFDPSLNAIYLSSLFHYFLESP